MTYVTRFAPSPTGPLHLGHAYSVLLAHDRARSEGGRMLLRIEDIDRQRSKPHWEQQIYDDLAWLGLSWDQPVMRQSERQPIYRTALERLWRRDLLYPCTCSRKDIEAATSAPQEGEPAIGPDGMIYPGTCRVPRDKLWSTQPLPTTTALRLDMASAALAVYAPHETSPDRTTKTLTFEETGAGPVGQHGWIEMPRADLTSSIGDVVVARRDMGTSYHISVVLDDAAQGVTEVIRGEDLHAATAIHVVLQRLLGLPTPRYHHHRLIRDAAGKRLAKRDDARSIAAYRAEGATPGDIRRIVGL